MKRILLFMLLFLFWGLGEMSAKVSVTGKVTDAKTGEPIVGAYVFIKNSNIGVLTAIDGFYTIEIKDEKAKTILVYDILGYVRQEIEYKKQKNINVKLEEDTQVLDETIVVAFGTTTKEAFTGSATVIKSDDLKKRQTTNVANALVGSVAGLQMKGASGAPGAGAGSMNIRGIASINAATDPLIIVDGAPYPAGLSNISQNDIESVTVLKDAASAALYGARGAAGVILITTKKAKSKNASINFDMKWGGSTRAIQDYETIESPAEYYKAYYTQLFNRRVYDGYDKFSANTWANQKMMNELAYNVYTLPEGQSLIGLNGEVNPKAVLGRKYLGGNNETYYLQPDDWKNAAYKTGFRQEYNLSINGAHNKGGFYASIGYLGDNGIIQYTGYNRLSTRLRADYNATKWLNIDANIAYTHAKKTANPNMGTDFGSNNIMHYTSNIAPIYPIFVRKVNDKGEIYINKDKYGHEQYDYGVQATNYFGLQRPFLATGNPLGSNRYNVDNGLYNTFNGTFSANFKFTDHLSAKIASTVIYKTTSLTSYANGFEGPKMGVKGEVNKQKDESLRTNNLQTLTYNNTWKGHSLNAMIGHEYYTSKYSQLYAAAQGAFSPEILEINAFAEKLQNSESFSSFYNVEGYFLSTSYDYNKKYYASLSYRRDASSKFYKKRRWGNFWSLGGAWIISKEKFLENVSWIDVLKLKASIGQQGQDGIKDFAYTDVYELSKASATEMSPKFSRIGNKDITWETTTNFNIGTEFIFWNGRFSGNIETYYKYTKDLLFWLSIPESAGTRGYFGNIGDIANYGVELSLTGTLVKTRNVDWSINLNLAHNKTKILKLPKSKIEKTGGYTDQGYWYAIGGPLQNRMMYDYAGVNEKGQALYYYDEEFIKRDANGKFESAEINKPSKNRSGTTTKKGEATKYAIGSSLPVVFGGFGTTLVIGDFDLSLTFDYQLGGTIYDSRYQALMSPTLNAQGAGSNFHKDWVKSWSVNNKSSNIPYWQYGDEYLAMESTRWLTSASYLNFQSFSIGYNIPLKKLGIKKVLNKCRVYAMGENLGFISARKGLDPRYSFGSSASMNVYSPVCTISGGIQLTF